MNILNNHHYIKNNFDVANNKVNLEQNINTTDNNVENKVSFKDLLSQRAQAQTQAQSQLNNKVVFSKHANMRINSRNINLTSEQIDRLEVGVDKARTKGINDSLVLIDDLALVVNVRNNIVVTAVENNDRVFTNIDGAVIA